MIALSEISRLESDKSSLATKMLKPWWIVIAEYIVIFILLVSIIFGGIVMTNARLDCVPVKDSLSRMASATVVVTNKYSLQYAQYVNSKCAKKKTHLVQTILPWILFLQPLVLLVLNNVWFKLPFTLSILETLASLASQCFDSPSSNDEVFRIIGSSISSVWGIGPASPPVDNSVKIAVTCLHAQVQRFRLAMKASKGLRRKYLIIAFCQVFFTLVFIGVTAYCYEVVSFENDIQCSIDKCIPVADGCGYFVCSERFGSLWQPTLLIYSTFFALCWLFYLTNLCWVLKNTVCCCLVKRSWDFAKMQVTTKALPRKNANDLDFLLCLLHQYNEQHVERFVLYLSTSSQFLFALENDVRYHFGQPSLRNDCADEEGIDVAGLIEQLLQQPWHERRGQALKNAEPTEEPSPLLSSNDDVMSQPCEDNEGNEDNERNNEILRPSRESKIINNASSKQKEVMILPVRGDGHCMFRAFHASLVHTENYYLEYLDKACAEILENLSFYGDKISSDTDIVEEFKKYRETKNYNQDIVDLFLYALANCTESTIDVVEIQDNTIRPLFEIPPTRPGVRSQQRIKLIRIGDHYDAVVSGEALQLQYPKLRQLFEIELPIIGSSDDTNHRNGTNKTNEPAKSPTIEDEIADETSRMPVGQPGGGTNKKNEPTESPTNKDEIAHEISRMPVGQPGGGPNKKNESTESPTNEDEIADETSRMPIVQPSGGTNKTNESAESPTFGDEIADEISRVPAEQLGCGTTEEEIELVTSNDTFEENETARLLEHPCPSREDTL